MRTTITEMNPLPIDFPTDEENDAHLKELFCGLASVAGERRNAAAMGLLALDHLAEMMRYDSGQCYKVRELLFALYNGKPCDLLSVVSLDWSIRKDVCAVILGFGFEDKTVSLFYDELKLAVTNVGLWDWFIEEAENLDKCREYVKAQNARRKEGKA